MNPRKTYKIIINNAKRRNPDIKGAWHHIKPRCIGGTDEARNLVKLTHREHFFCHYLLTKIHPNENKLHLAYYFMSNVCCKKISAKHYEKSMEKALEYLKETTKISSIDRWNDPEKKYKIGRKKVTFREYMSWKVSQQDHSFMTDKYQLKCNQSKCLKWMWRYLSENNITEKDLTDEIIKNGWKSRRGYQSNTWRKFFKSFKKWKNALLTYLHENPIDVTFSYKHKEPSKESKIKRQKTRMIHDFERIYKEGRFINNDYIQAKYYYENGRCYRTLNWKKYFTKKEWISITNEIIDNQ